MVTALITRLVKAAVDQVQRGQYETAIACLVHARGYLDALEKKVTQ